MKLTFLGADREVTGSCTQVEAAGHRFLVDCGMEQGRDVYENADLPCAPGTYEALLLTHAHIDHSGRIPYLYKNGYRGPIYTTDATRDLCAIMLEDSAHIQEQEAEWKNRKAMRSGAEGTVSCRAMAAVTPVKAPMLIKPAWPRDSSPSTPTVRFREMAMTM